MNKYLELNCFNICSVIFWSKNVVEYDSPDFNEILLVLRNDHGLTHEKIANLLPVKGASTVTEWSRGGMPNYENGYSLIELWRILTGKPEIDIPRKNRYVIA